MGALLPSLRAIEAERGRRSLSYFMQRSWHIIEPGNVYVHNWHIDLISEYLTAVTNGQVRNLIINIPPRHMKSLLVAVVWPVWVWTHTPEKRFLTASYAAELAIRDAVKSRRIIQDAWFQERWGHVFKLAGDQNVKSRYENDQAGHRVSVGVEGGATGEGGDIIIVDDPLKAGDAESDAVRDAANQWWQQTMSTRGNDPKTVAKVVIMQRLHEDDLTGHLLEEMKNGGELYEHLCLPAEYEPHRFVSGIGLADPRTTPGELLWPERFGAQELGTLKKNLGSAAPGQLQQRPAPAGGAIFKAEWWAGEGLATPDNPLGGVRYDIGERGHFNRSVGRWLSFDTALKDAESNDYTAMNVGELTPEYTLLLRMVWKRKLEFPQLARTIEDEAGRWNYDGKLRGILIEDKGSGTTSLQSLRQGNPALGTLLIAINPQGSKTYRARQASLWCERGCVLLPVPNGHAPWLLDFTDNLYKFPVVRHDDDVDAFDQLIIYLENLLAEGWKLRTKNHE